jgi:hypothetical protein
MQRRKQLVGLFAITAALVAVVPAQARPMEVGANDRAHNAVSASEIPYLSQGIGVNEEDFSGSAPSTEIPYLSQGIGVNKEDFSGSAPSTQTGVSPDDRSLPRGTPVEPAPIVVTNDSGWSVDFALSVTAVALMLGLLAGGTLVGIWSNRRTKLSPA